MLKFQELPIIPLLDIKNSKYLYRAELLVTEVSYR